MSQTTTMKLRQFRGTIEKGYDLLRSSFDSRDITGGSGRVVEATQGFIGTPLAALQLGAWADAALALNRQRGLAFFCDAAQWIGKTVGGPARMGEDMIGSEHNIGSSQGVRFLKYPAEFQSLLLGSPQEEDRRAGTEDVAGVLARETCAGAGDALRIGFGENVMASEKSA